MSSPGQQGWQTEVDTVQHLRSLRLAYLCLSFIQIDAADGYRGRRRRKGRQIWKRKTDLKCALAMVASEARLVVNDTVCCQLLYQIHSLIARLTLLLCAGK
jgi:hypothetical protein